MDDGTETETSASRRRPGPAVDPADEARLVAATVDVATPRRRGAGGRPWSDDALQWLAVALIAAAAAVIAASAGCEPTGFAPADAVLTGGFAALVTVATAQAHRWTWLVMAGMAGVAARDVAPVETAAAAVIVAFLAVAVMRHRNRVLGATVGALAVQVLVRLPDVGFHGLPSLWAFAAVMPALVSGYRRCRRTTRRGILIGGLALATFAIAATIGFAVAAMSSRQQLVDAGNTTKKGFESARAGREDEAKAAFRKANQQFRAAASTISSPWAQAARLVPVVGQQAAAADAIAASGADLTDVGSDAAGKARYDELRTSNGQVNLRLLSDMREPVIRVADSLERSDERLGGVESSWLAEPLAGPLNEFRGEVTRAKGDARLAADGLAVAPGMLGADGTRHYLLLFANPAESRFLGGFVAAYGELEAANGKLTLTKSGRIGDLSNAPGAEDRRLTNQARFLERYGRWFPERFLQNLTVSPDFPTDAEVARELYPQAGGGPIDGVIYVDPEGLAALLKLTGPVTVEGSPQPLTSDNAASFLMKDQYALLPKFDERTDFSARATRATFDALTSRELPGPRRLGEVLGPATRQGHLLMYPFAEADRAMFDKLGALGRFPTAAGGDLLSVRAADADPNKIDAYVHRDITYDVTVDPVTGEVKGTMRMVVRNDAPATGLPDYVTGIERPDVPRATSTSYVTVYSPLRVDRATFDGAALPVAEQREFGMRASSFELIVPPQSQRTFEVTLVGAVSTADGYNLLLVPQPRVNADRLSATVRATPGWVVLDDQGAVAPQGALSVSADRFVEPVRVAARFRPA